MSNSQRLLHKHLRNNGFLKDQDQEERLAPLAEFGLTLEGYLKKSHKDRYRILKRLKEFGQFELVEYLKEQSHAKQRA